MLFAEEETHFGPKPTRGLPAWKGKALCGVVYATAGASRNPPMPCGSSTLEFVTCVACLAKAEAKQTSAKKRSGKTA
jgi:hypothetical protein